MLLRCYGARGRGSAKLYAMDAQEKGLGALLARNSSSDEELPRDSCEAASGKHANDKGFGLK